MKTLKTQLADGIYGRLCSGKPDAALVSNDDTGTRCSIGGRMAAHTDYRISLEQAGKKIRLSSDLPREFAVLLDRGGPQQSVRMVFYLDDDPIPVIEYDQAEETNAPLRGYMTIVAYDDYEHPAIIQALFTGGESSLLLEADPKVVTHLQLSRNLIDGE